MYWSSQPEAVGGGGLQRHPIADITFVSGVSYAYFSTGMFDAVGVCCWRRFPIALPQRDRVTLTGVLSEYRPDLAHGLFILWKAGCCSDCPGIANGFPSTDQSDLSRYAKVKKRYPPMQPNSISSGDDTQRFLIIPVALCFYGYSRGGRRRSQPLETFPRMLGNWHMLQQGRDGAGDQGRAAADDYSPGITLHPPPR